jgi:hypothetical protein
VVFPEIKEQRCWNHRLLNLRDKLPLKLQGEVNRRDEEAAA